MDPSDVNKPGPAHTIPRRPVDANQRRGSGRPTIGIRRNSSRHYLSGSASRQHLIAASPSPQLQTETSSPQLPQLDLQPRAHQWSQLNSQLQTQPSRGSLVRDFAHQGRTTPDLRPPSAQSNNDPARPDSAFNLMGMPSVVEESGPSNGVYNMDTLDKSLPHIPAQQQQRTGVRGMLDMFTPSGRARRRRNDPEIMYPAGLEDEEYEHSLVNLLDVIDPEVSTLSTLTNVQNSLFVPDLGNWINRRPTYNLTQIMPERIGQPSVSRLNDDALQEEVDKEALGDLDASRDDSDLRTIDSRMTESRYAVLPHGVTLDGWSHEEKLQLNDHVRHMLHSRRAALRRGLKGFGQYVRRPLGFAVTLYAFLITVFGFAWVLFLIGWVDLGAKRSLIIRAIDYTLVCLFAIVGDGLIPWRTIDTYHMIYIAHYHHLTWKIRNEQNLPKLPNHNDLPDDVPGVGSSRQTTLRTSADLEAGGVPSTNRYSSLSMHNRNNTGYYSVLSLEQQKKLEHHQNKFSKSHTFYKPHETETHFAFPLRLLVAIVVILDFHSIFQLTLGLCTFAIQPHKVAHHEILTTCILACSLTCNITGGILISVGDKRTRKKDVREKMFRQALTEDAIRQMQKEKRKEEEPVPEVIDERADEEIIREESKRKAAGV